MGAGLGIAIFSLITVAIDIAAKPSPRRLAVDPADVARITPIVPPSRPRAALTNRVVSLFALDRASVRLSQGTFTFAASMSIPYRVEWSNDLRVWLPVALDTVGSSVKLVTATNATNRAGFFRLRALP